MRYLILNKFIHYSIKKSRIFFFNTLSKKNYFSDNISIINTFKNSKDEYIIEIDYSLFTPSDYQLLNKIISENNLGYISNKRNFVFYPIKKQSDNNSIILNELTIHLNYFNNINNSSFDEYNQFIYPKRSIENKTMSFSEFKKVINLFYHKELQINVVFNNYNLITDFKKKINFLITKEIKVNFYFLIQDYKFIKIYNHKLFSYNLLIDSPNQLMFHKQYLNNLDINFLLITTNLDEYKKYINFSEILNLKSFEITPFFNGDNYLFFKENIYNDKDDIINYNQTIYEIKQKNYFSTLLFGKLIILPNGDIYTNTNDNVLNNIHSIDTVEYNYEIFKDCSWYKTRSNLTPCSNCFYELICPPMSNYELAININNLCNIYE